MTNNLTQLPDCFDEHILSLSADTSDGLWSDPLELHTCHNIPVQKRTPFHLRNHFTTLTLDNQGIQELDAELGKFENLRELDVGGNQLREVSYVPQIKSMADETRHVDSSL